MKPLTTTIILMIFFFGLIVFNYKTNSGFQTKVKEAISDVFGKDEQADITAESVILSLKEGNERFVNNDTHEYDFSAQVKEGIEGQFPKASVLACTDSRVPVERLFDKSIGDLYVARVAGNLVNEDILGSLEYASKVEGSKVIVVLGHENCTAIRSAIEGLEFGNMTNLLAKIAPAIDKANDYEGEKSIQNIDYVNYVSELNILDKIEEIKLKSPILKEMSDNGSIQIVGAIYHMESGEVTFL
ncbi:MAG: carbonic anhydrase family protein [Chitinophagales bacterium]